MVNASEQGEVTVLERGRGGLRRGEDTGETVNVGVNPLGASEEAPATPENEVPEGEPGAAPVPDPRSMSPT